MVRSFWVGDADFLCKSQKSLSTLSLTSSPRAARHQGSRWSSLRAQASRASSRQARIPQWGTGPVDFQRAEAWIPESETSVKTYVRGDDVEDKKATTAAKR
jgi:hypothetical protein